MARSVTKHRRSTAAPLHSTGGSPREKPLQGYTPHVIAIVLSVSVGTTFGFALVFSFGKWLTPAAAIVLPNTGRIEEIRMPVGARKLEDVGTFVIKGGGGDDFGRVYVNNYLTHSGESPDLLFFTNSPNGKQARDEVMSYATNLNNYMLGDKDVVAFLRRGDNYIIQELENSIFGTCVSTIRIEVNKALIEHFPQTMPTGILR